VRAMPPLTDVDVIHDHTLTAVGPMSSGGRAAHGPARVMRTRTFSASSSELAVKVRSDGVSVGPGSW
jgi:hypothetical protein